jgi:hypothetical protein
MLRMPPACLITALFITVTEVRSWPHNTKPLTMTPLLFFQANVELLVVFIALR